jgi:hypothetical protein
MMYTFGSKRILDEFASACFAKMGHLPIANAFLPNFGMKEMFSATERVPAQHPLCLVIYNIDALVFRMSTAKVSLSLLASNPRVRLVASHQHALTTATSGAPSRRGYAWLLHDLTMYVDHSSI